MATSLRRRAKDMRHQTAAQSWPCWSNIMVVSLVERLEASLGYIFKVFHNEDKRVMPRLE
ncbi:hypothetical protein N7453_003399 [Penicillium expansum]|nr:hypothetical protein N7453_003399 [Penicillium expansum]